jgi:hypothetical protein
MRRRGWKSIPSDALAVLYRGSKLSVKSPREKCSKETNEVQMNGGVQFLTFRALQHPSTSLRVPDLFLRGAFFGG